VRPRTINKINKSLEDKRDVQRSCVYPLIRLEARNLRSLKQKISSSCPTRSFSAAVSRKSVQFDGK
jgi:hypothetical protein